jgi:predicted glycoside hydrolase/deacetylase ChbG (UPF0249 family)
MGREPDHIDSHQHVHRREPAASVLARAARTLRLPLRGDGTARYVGGFYGQDDVGGTYPEGIGVPRLLELLDALEVGLTEFGCHPGHVGDDEPLGGTAYRVERNVERRTLCDPRVLARVARGDIVLASFGSAAR